MKENNKLPKYWYIKGGIELKEYLNDNGIISAYCSGSISSYGYYIVEHEIWNCMEVCYLHGYQEITLQQYLNAIKPNINNTNTNKMKSIEIPEGYEINLQKLIELGIVTKPVQETKKIAETYDDIVESQLFYLRSTQTFAIYKDYLENINAFIKLLNTAKYLNNRYEKEENNEHYYFHIIDSELLYTFIDEDIIYDSSIFFRSEQAIKKALEILGEETIKLALKFN